MAAPRVSVVVLLLSLGLAWGLLSLVGAEGERPPSAAETAGATGQSGGQTLLRDFSLPLPLFAADSAWNQRASGAAVLLESDEQILVTYRVLRGDASTLSPPDTPPVTWPFMNVSYDDWTIPVFEAGTGQQSVSLCDYDGNPGWPSPDFPDVQQQEGGPVTVPAPIGPVRPSGPQEMGADGHLVLYDAETFTEYDFWQATTVRDGPCQSRGGGLTGTAILEAGAIDVSDVRGPGTNPDTYASARAHGTPLLAGLIVPEDVESGAIRHALGFAIPGPRNLGPDPSEPLPSDYFYPASTTEVDFYNTNPNALAAGQRIRLKQTIVDDEGNPIDEGELAPITRMFLTALRDYGAYLVDNAGGFSISAEDMHTAALDLTDDEVNALIGAAAGTPLPVGRTTWQIVVEKLNQDLELIPIAYGPWQEGQDPATATIETSNLEVIGNASPPGVPTATPVPTPAPGEATATPVSTPSAAATGDANCDGTVDSTDAALVLQLDAGLITSLACQDAADVNDDGAVNSLDAALILQYDAGLIDSLGPQAATLWRPAPGTTWQLQLSGTLDLAVEAEVWDIDLFDTASSVVGLLHEQGSRAVCYMSAGSWEDWRPDADQFPDAVLGEPLLDWPGERWLDIRRFDVLGPIMEARLDLCRDKGFDGVELDNVDGYTNSTGFPLTYQDQLAYNTFLADAAHERGLSAALKNDLEQITDLLPLFDFAVSESCFQYDECALLLPFIEAGEAVFEVEYALETSAFCPQANALGLSAMRKRLELDAYREPCWG